MQSINQRYCAGSYERISREDAMEIGSGKNESNSISNQRDLIRNFVKSNEDIELLKEYADDGFSGVNFERPGFCRMMEDIRAGVINCVIVKDLSRFGRNYIEVGKYLEKIFPLLGVRFIAISENYDTANSARGSDQLVIPFMNLVNDVYCRDISVKIRTSFEMKQKKGDYVGSFAPYGYKKAPDDIHHFVIDEKAAVTVRRIFELTLAGVSNKNIAELLNREGVLSPAGYKQMEGGKYFAAFQKKPQPEWSALTIRRILMNRVYIGTLEQGKTYSVNYKVKERRARDRERWYSVENSHEPIVDRKTFELVQKVLDMGCRTSPGRMKSQEETVYPFSGLVHCGQCGEILLRRKKTMGGRAYVYYGCYDRNKKLRCKNVCIREDRLERIVTEIIRQHAHAVINLPELLEDIQKLPTKKREVKRLDSMIGERDKAVERCRKLKMKVYEDYRDGLIGQQEYREFEAVYGKREKEEAQKREELLQKRKHYLAGEAAEWEWMRIFMEWGEIGRLNRMFLLTLVDEIVVHSSGEIEIKFRYKDEFDLAKEIVASGLGEAAQTVKRQVD